MTGSSTFLAIIAAILLLGSIPLFLLVRGENDRHKAWAEALRTQGRETNGQVIRLWHTNDKSRTPKVTYAFSANGLRLHGDASVPRDIWRGLQPDSTLPIRYLPSDPKVNHPAAWEISSDPDWVPVTLPAVVVGLGFVLLLILRRQAQMVAEGLPAAGVVTKCFAVKGGWSVRYQFRMKDGTIAGGSSQTSQRLAVGTAICVLYLPQRPRRNAMYPNSYYRVVQ